MLRPLRRLLKSLLLGADVFRGDRVSTLVLTAARGSHSKAMFLASLPEDARVLDVGCGNNSAMVFRYFKPTATYVGLDVGDYNQAQDPSDFADEYVVVPPQDFAAAIAARKAMFDAVVSSHNLEHCDDPQAVLEAMAHALVPGGVMYLAFPTEKSVGFPKRRGTLNFFDDTTHQHMPVFADVKQTVVAEGLDVTYARKRYRPFPRWVLGLLQEPASSVRRKTLFGTWALWGFETVIWARRP